jgi:hypothetical protein
VLSGLSTIITTFPGQTAAKACLQAAQNLAELYIITCSDFSTGFQGQGAAILPFAQLDRVHHVTTCKRTQVACRNFLK